MYTLPVVYGALCFISGAAALPQPDHNRGHEPFGHEFAPPGPFDSRSPCPGLNALANHGWLPRSGKNISYEDIQFATGKGFNFAPDVFLDAFLTANQTFNLSTTGSSLTIHLRDLSRHDTIEQDGSQTRNDIYFGDNTHFDANVFSGVAASLGLEDFSRTRYVTVQTAAKARAERQVVAKRVNPTFDDTPGQMFGSIATTALYLGSLWDFDAQAVPKKWIRPFLAEDRIPYKEGFTSPKVRTGDFLGKMVTAVQNATST